MPSLAEDRDAIRDLFARYSLYTDTQQPDAYAALFTDDGELVAASLGMHAAGRDALRELASSYGTAMHHAVVNEVIDVDGDRADARSSFLVLSGGQVAMSGRYTDALQRVDGEWRIARRELVFDALA